MRNIRINFFIGLAVCFPISKYLPIVDNFPHNKGLFFQSYRYSQATSIDSFTSRFILRHLSDQSPNGLFPLHRILYALVQQCLLQRIPTALVDVAQR